MRPLTTAIVAFSLFIATQAQEQRQDPTQSIVNAMQERRSAETRGDVAQWEILVSPDCVWIEPNGRRTGFGSHKPSGNKQDSTVKSDVRLSEYESRDLGIAVVLTYREDVSSSVNDKIMRTAVRFTEIYHKDSNRWILVYSAETPIVERTGVEVDPSKFKDFLGEYEIAPGLIGFVAFDGNKLTLFSKGWSKPFELVPLSENRFFVREFETTEITFVRDASGKVTHHTSDSPRQPTIIAKKVR